MIESNNISNIPNHATRNTVLVAPLDWGLGHATRCIPIIKELQEQNFDILIAASGATSALLQKEFPGIEILTIDNYNIRYSKTKWGFSFKMISQIFKIRKTIQKENRWLSQLIKNRRIQVVVSDNRPGLHHSNAHCIYITHQLNIKTGNKFTDFLASAAHQHFINKFDECWIPDTNTGNLAGELSYPLKKNLKARYINPLSRFDNKSVKETFDIAILLSGPEPQRSILENQIVSQLYKTTQRVIMVRGLPESDKTIPPPNGCTIINHLDAEEMNNIVCAASLVISRSGYTSIMDFAKLRKNACLIPTPGQPEQEYLARLLANRKIFMMQNQSSFDLESAWNKAQSFTINFPEIDFNAYKTAIKDLSNKIV